jgi:predicted dehydrogenase
MSKKNSAIKVGVVGLGRAGWNIHVNRMRDDERFQITAVTDLQEDRLQEAKAEFGCDTFTDFNEFLKNADCDVVVIASQSKDHAPQTIAALKSGRHVIVEKPMSMNVAEANKMIKAAEAADKKLFVHQNYRYHPDVQHIKEIIKSGILGRVFEIRMRALSFNRRNDWQTLQKFGGGNLNNTCPHFVDAALLLLDSPVKRLFTDLQLTTDVGDADDHTKIVLKGENGRVVDMEVSTSCAFTEPKWTVLGTAGTLRSDGKTSELKYFDPKKLKPLKVKEGTPENRAYGSGDVLPWQEETRPSTTEVPTDFYDNVYSVLKKRKKMDITPEEVREVMRVIETAHKENPLPQVFA